ncbi:WD40/YVTN/BNR-like repeat-containing protein [Marinomonas polaris]|uniref:Photosynthesis system II assembly factor YCF48 n=1 Tax=Marinomonas polaris DSM 16579 TaxID=1122206 RepID=A0A1M4VQQ3_9GAMM|nr:YCF48-related protein [Marinomonas polaris]SHE71384.1 Photosynthesis system II assembly factor YCF48 [Marinomonas polaris DSM 16579]
MSYKNTTETSVTVVNFWRKLGRYTIMALLLCRIDGAVSAVADAIERPAIESHLVEHSVLMAASYAGSHLIAVGERGLILRSDDDGKSWQQQPSPVSVTLTGVDFSDEKNGYAIGHGGIVLRTVNGGAEWKVQLDGRTLAQNLLQKAEASKDEEAIYQAKLLVSDGPDKPFLDMLLLGPDHLIVVGAYGLALETKDGGKTWVSWIDRIQNYFGLHLYSIRKQADRILIAGEQGFVAFSTDNGQTFATLETPYEGSFFTAQLLGDSEIVLAGLRGNTFISDDNGADWKNIKNPISASILASFINANGQVIMANQAGILLGLTENRLVPLTRKRLPPLTNILEKTNGSVLALSVNGPVSIDVGDLK